MFRIWIEHSNNSHGILVPFIFLVLIWNQRNKLNWEKIESSKTGIFIILFSLFMYIIGVAGAIEVLPRVSIVTTLAGLVIYHLGLRNFYKISFPFLFLFFMVPVPVSIITKVSLPLQLLVTKISASIIKLMSIPVYREGNMLYFANVSLEVAEACSGIRSLIAFFMLSSLFAYSSKGFLSKRLVILLSAVPLAFFVNLLRVTGTGILAHYFGGSVARGFLHEFSGIVVFWIGLVLLFIISKLFKTNTAKLKKNC